MLKVNTIFTYRGVPYTSSYAPNASVAYGTKRIQVLLDSYHADQVEELAKAENSSMSKIIADCFKDQTCTEEYQERLKKARQKLNSAKNELIKIIGSDIDEDKLQEVMKVLNNMGWDNISLILRHQSYQSISQPLFRTGGERVDFPPVF